MNKKQSWLNVLEYASLVGLGIGSVASLLSSQFFYASAPLSALALLNLANRRRLEQETEHNAAIAIQQLDQKLTGQLEVLHHHVNALPTAEMVGNVKKTLLIKNQQSLEQVLEELSRLQQDVYQRLKPLEDENVGVLKQDVIDLHHQYQQICQSIEGLNGQLIQVAAAHRFEDVEEAIAQLKADAAQLRTSLQTLTEQTKPTLTSLQEQVNHLTRQVQKLPPPFDGSALKQEVSELMRVVADLVPRRDWSNLVAELKLLHQQQESYSQNEEILRQRLQELNQQLQARPAKANLTLLQNQINSLHRQFQKLPPPFDPSSLKKEVSELVRVVANHVPRRDLSALAAQVKVLQQQQEFQKQVEDTLRRELDDINRQIRELATPSDTTNTPNLTPLSQGELQSHIETILGQELRSIHQQFQNLPNHPELQAQVEESLRRELQEVNRQLREFPTGPQYELIFDFKSSHTPEGQRMPSNSRAVLEAAIARTQRRLIVILPWSSLCDLDGDLLRNLEAFLQSGKHLDFGWSHTVGRSIHRFLSPINHRWSISALPPNVQATLQTLLRWKRAYPDRFQFKVMGTCETFLVSDASYTVVGMDEALRSVQSLPAMELKLRTNDPEIIQQSIQRFDHPPLDAGDGTAYWNRAVTRYDLGDRQGALADFNEILHLSPDDAVAFNYRGLVRYDLGDRQGALSDFEHSIQLNPAQGSVYCNRGFVRSEQGDQLSAIADFSAAIEQQPDWAIAYFYRGLACQKYNDFLAAVSDFSEAIRLAPTGAMSYYYRAQAFQKLENWGRAMADFKIATHLFMEQGNASNAEKALRGVLRLKQTVGAQLATPPNLNEIVESTLNAALFSASQSNTAQNGNHTRTSSRELTISQMDASPATPPPPFNRTPVTDSRD